MNVKKVFIIAGLSVTISCGSLEKKIEEQQEKITRFKITSYGTVIDNQITYLNREIKEVNDYVETYIYKKKKKKWSGIDVV